MLSYVVDQLGGLSDKLDQVQLVHEPDLLVRQSKLFGPQWPLRKHAIDRGLRGRGCGVIIEVTMDLGTQTISPAFSPDQGYPVSPTSLVLIFDPPGSDRIN